MPSSDPSSNLILLSPETGEVLNSQLLDFETIQEVVFLVRAHTVPLGQAGVPGQDRTSDARITIKIKDINDNPPVFQQPYYETSIPESMLPNVRKKLGTLNHIQYFFLIFNLWIDIDISITIM